jgi:hypothetical protein
MTRCSVAPSVADEDGAGVSLAAVPRYAGRRIEGVVHRPRTRVAGVIQHGANGLLGDGLLGDGLLGDGLLGTDLVDSCSPLSAPPDQSGPRARLRRPGGGLVAGLGARDQGAWYQAIGSIHDQQREQDQREPTEFAVHALAQRFIHAPKYPD